MTVAVFYCIFALLAIAIFRFLAPARAVLVVFLGGWLVLPVGNFPDDSVGAAFPYWITGLAIPSDMLLTKAWVAPVAAMLGVLFFDRAVLRGLRRSWADLPIILWCVWPLLQGAVLGQTRPNPVISSLYLSASWGLPWLLGRLYFGTREGQVELLRGLAVAGLACLPISVIEGILGPQVYEWLYGPHPFLMNGADRYIGYRPLGFFENGNQFGIWISLCALAAVWAAIAARPDDTLRRPLQATALVCVVLAIAAQSVGGLVLAMAGALALATSSVLRPRVIASTLLAVTVVGGAVYLSGKVPVERLAKETVLGQATAAAFSSIGRGSFNWRIARDQDLLPLATSRPVTGTGHWDWWRPEQTRPWGLTLLVLGQFGGVGVVLSTLALAGSSFAAAWRAPRASAWRVEAAPLALAVIVTLAMFDSLLNSFWFFPALVAAGALAPSSDDRA